MKKSPKTPAAPDPAVTAAAQSQTNKDTAYWNAVLNNVNQVTPYGNLTYSQTGGGKKYNQAGYDQAMAGYNKALSAGATSTPAMKYGSPEWIAAGRPSESQMAASATAAKGALPPMPKLEDFLIADAPPQFTSTINLSPAEQAKLDKGNANELALLDMGSAQLGRINEAVSKPFSFGGLPAVYDDAGAAAKGEEALLSRLDPRFAADEERLRTRLINQGIGQGSDAYKKEFDTLNQAKNDARQQAVIGGQTYARALLDDSLTRRNQAIQEYSTERNAPLNEYIALTSGTQVQNPTFNSQNYAGAAAPDLAGLINQQYQSQLGAYNSKIASNNATTGALFGLGASAAFAPVTGGGSLFGNFLNSKIGA